MGYVSLIWTDVNRWFPKTIPKQQVSCLGPKDHNLKSVLLNKCFSVGFYFLFCSNDASGERKAQFQSVSGGWDCEEALQFDGIQNEDTAELRRPEFLRGGQRRWGIHPEDHEHWGQQGPRPLGGSDVCHVLPAAEWPPYSNSLAKHIRPAHESGRNR